VLVAHDFCLISYNNLQSEGLGYLANKEGRGIITYNRIAISEDGIPLSLLRQDSFTRLWKCWANQKNVKRLPSKIKRVIIGTKA
jgi:hypothetical protein